MLNPDGPPLSYLSCPETTIPVSRHDHYSFTSLHNLPAIHNIHTMRQAADTGTCCDASAVKGIDACGRTVVCRLRADAFYSCALTTEVRCLDDVLKPFPILIIQICLLGTYWNIEVIRPFSVLFYNCLQPFGFYKLSFARF